MLEETQELVKKHVSESVMELREKVEVEKQSVPCAGCLHLQCNFQSSSSHSSLLVVQPLLENAH